MVLTKRYTHILSVKTVTEPGDLKLVDTLNASVCVVSMVSLRCTDVVEATNIIMSSCQLLQIHPAEPDFEQDSSANANKSIALPVGG